MTTNPEEPPYPPFLSWDDDGVYLACLRPECLTTHDGHQDVGRFNYSATPEDAARLRDNHVRDHHGPWTCHNGDTRPLPTQAMDDDDDWECADCGQEFFAAFDPGRTMRWIAYGPATGRPATAPSTAMAVHHQQGHP